MTLLRTARFKVDVLASREDGLWPGWRWRPRITRPWPGAVCLTWGNWHLVASRFPGAAERREGRARARALLDELRRDGWEAAR